MPHWFTLGKERNSPFRLPLLGSTCYPLKVTSPPQVDQIRAYMIQFFRFLVNWLKKLESKMVFSDSVLYHLREKDGFSQGQVFFIRNICCYVCFLKIMIYAVTFYGTPLIDQIEKKNGVGIAKFPIISAASVQLYHCDNIYYLGLASHGYSQSFSKYAAFYPAWPMLLRFFGCGEFDGMYESGFYWSPLVSAVISIVFWAAGLFLLFRWATRTMSSRMAWSIVLANLLLPSSMTFWIGFSESLFFFLFVCFLVFSDGARPWLAWIAAFFLSLTRPVGIMVLIIPAVSVLIDHRRKVAIGSVFGFLLGWVVYFGTMWYTMGDPLSGWIAQKFYTNQPSLLYLFEMKKFFNSFMLVKSFHDPVGSFLDRFVFILAVICVLRLWLIRPSWCLAACCMLLIPAITNQFLSFSRFTIVVIPLLVPIGLALLQMKKHWLFCVIALSLGTQYYLIYSYFSGEWGT